MPNGAGAGSVRYRCASPSPGTPLPPCLLPNVEGCSCPFPHFSFASKSTVLARKKLSSSLTQSHLSYIYLASFDKGPVLGRAQGTALHSASLRTGLGLPLWSCSHSVSSGAGIPAPCLGPSHAPRPESPRQPARGGPAASAHRGEGASTETLSPAPRYLSTATSKYPCETQKPKSSPALNCRSCVFGHRLPDR